MDGLITESFCKLKTMGRFGVKQDKSFTEEKLEAAILGNLREFLMELGKGYAFVARQQHIHTEKDDYYIDLLSSSTRGEWLIWTG